MRNTVIIWTSEAWTDLDNVFDFLFLQSVKAADKTIGNILSRTRQLEGFPESGQYQNTLESKTKYRYLVEGNYKIIYTFTNGIIYIRSVFDCRQDPDKLLKL